MGKSCSNCKKRLSDYPDMCSSYEMAETEEEYVKTAESCDNYCEETEEDRERTCKEYEYTPSATASDYSPSCPQNAPGMSIHDFI